MIKHRIGFAAATLALTLLAGVNELPAAPRSPNALVTEVAADLAHGRIAVNGVRLHYVRAGKGPAIVFLHGFPQTWYEWRKVLPALSRKHTVIAFDLRGLGDSERTTGGYDAGSAADDIAQALAELKISGATIVGHDIAGSIAYLLAARHPELIDGLFLVETLLPSAGMEQLLAKAGPALWHIPFHSTPEIPEALVAGRERLYLSLFFRSFSYNPDVFSDADIDYFARRYESPGAMRAAFNYFRANPQNAQQVRAQMQTKLSIPVMGLVGRASLGNPALGDPLKAGMAAVADDVAYEVVEEAGHWIPEEHPALLIDRLERFSARTRATGAK
jgi:pimeloyl-ACP methyl ester carboxylesterase